jgi:predicted small lipoprotein YifL
MKNRIMLFLGLLVVVSMVLAACGPAETPATEAPVETQAPVVETAG